MPVSSLMITAAEDALADALVNGNGLTVAQETINAAWHKHDLHYGIPTDRAPSGNRWLMYAEGNPDMIMVAAGFRKTKESEIIFLADPLSLIPNIEIEEEVEGDA